MASLRHEARWMLPTWRNCRECFVSPACFGCVSPTKKGHRAGAHGWPSSLYDVVAAFLSERDSRFTAHIRMSNIPL
jgi:hypothetical protein